MSTYLKVIGVYFLTGLAGCTVITPAVVTAAGALAVAISEEYHGVQAQKAVPKEKPEAVHKDRVDDAEKERVHAN